MMAAQAAPSFTESRGLEDSLFRALVVLAILLEVAVFVEPAPVDALLVLCVLLGLAFGKLSFANADTLPVVSLAIFALANVVSMYDPVDPQRAVVYLLITLYVVASWFFFTGVITKYGTPFLRVLMYAYCFAGLMSAFLGVGAFAGLLPHADILLHGGRARGLFKDSNVYGPYFVPMALFAFMRLSDETADWREKAFAFLCFPAATLGALFSFSRACWINYGVAIGVLFAFQVLLSHDRSAWKRAAVGICVLAAGGFLVAMVLNTSGVSEMMTIRLNGDRLQYYDRVRFATQAVALRTAAERPLGVGPGQAEVVFQYSTHSLYVRVLVENGIAALLSLLVFILATAWRAGQLARYARDGWIRDLNLVALAAIAGFAVNSAVIDTIHWRYSWFILALPWGCTLPMLRRLPGSAPLRFAQSRPASRMRMFPTPAFRAAQATSLED